jgi:hypothetical protein
MADQRLMAGRTQPPSQLGDRVKAGFPRDDAPASAALAVPARRSLGGDLGIGGGVLGLSQRSVPATSGTGRCQGGRLR